MDKPSLPDAVLRELQSIVGPRFVTTDPAVLACYAWNSGIGKPPGPDRFANCFPLANVMPATVEEVAAIVKCCVRHELQYRAHSTGYGGMNHVQSDRSIGIDLRRMNSLEIDAENRMAIIGPYATAGMVQAEALKHGLTSHVIGAGPVHSPLASSTSLFGVGITSNSTSMNVRNLLAWEWVTPEGEIVRGGSAAGGHGWFAGEGPGPGTRGLLRGSSGAGGGLGVFTKIGYKLYPIPLKGVQPGTGRRPQLGAAVPENFGLFHIVWPTWEALRDATFELIEDNLCWSFLRMPPEQLGWTLTGTNAEFVQQTRDGTLTEAARYENAKHWTLFTASRSAAEHAWKKGVIEDVVKRTGGRFIQFEREEEEVLCRNFLNSVYVARSLRPSGGITTSFGVFDSPNLIPTVMKSGEQMLNRMNKPGEPGGHLIHGGPEEFWNWIHENRYFWAENIVNFDPNVKEAKEQALFALLRQFPIIWKNHAGVAVWEVGPVMELQGWKVGGPQHYIRGIKHYLDPKDSSFTKEFIPFHIPKPVQMALPILKPLIVSDPVLKFAAKQVAKTGL